MAKIKQIKSYEKIGLSELRKMKENENLIPLEDFFEAYYQCRKHKRRTHNALMFERNYEQNLAKLWYEVNTKSYEIGESICFLVSRPKLREVFAADFRDRVIHHIIMMRLEPLFEEVFIEDNYNCRKGKGTLYGVIRLFEQIKEFTENYTKPCYVGKFDLCGFFMSIHKPTLWKMLEAFIDEKYFGKDKEILLYLVRKVVLHCPEKNCRRNTNKAKWKKLPKNKSLFTCGEDYGLPIGNLTSQCFANFYMHYFDLYMKQYFPFYGRYVDDYYVLASTKECIIEHVNDMDKYLRTVLKVHLHPDKIYIQDYRKGVKFVGSVVKRNRMYIGNQTVSGMYDKIRFFNENICKEEVEHLMQSLNSYLGFLKHYKTYNIKKKMMTLIDPKWYNYIGFDVKGNDIHVVQQHDLLS